MLCISIVTDFASGVSWPHNLRWQGLQLKSVGRPLLQDPLRPLQRSAERQVGLVRFTDKELPQIRDSSIVACALPSPNIESYLRTLQEVTHYALVMAAAEKVVALRSSIGSLHANGVAQYDIASMAASKLSSVPFATGKLQDKTHAVRFFPACLFQPHRPMSTSSLAADNALVSMSAVSFAVSGLVLLAKQEQVLSSQATR